MFMLTLFNFGFESTYTRTETATIWGPKEVVVDYVTRTDMIGTSDKW